MLTKRLLDAMRFTCYINDTLKITPLCWDSRNSVAKISKSKWRMLSSRITVLLFTLAYFYAFGTLLTNLFKKKSDLTVPRVIFFLILLLEGLIVIVLGIFIEFQGEFIARSLNAAIKMDSSLKQMYPKWADEPNPDIVGLFMCAAAPGALSGCFVYALFCAFHPDSPYKLLMAAVFPQFLVTWPPFILMELILFYWCTLFIIFELDILLIAAVMYMNIVKHWHTYVSNHLPLHVEKSAGISTAQKNLRKNVGLIVRKVMSMNRVNLIHLNECLYHLAPFLIFVFLIWHIICSFAVIKLYHIFGMPYYLVFPFVNIVLFGVEIVLFSSCGQIFSISEDFRNTWMLRGDKHMRIWVRGVPDLGINVGPFFTISRDTTISYMEALVNHTIDLVLSVKV